MSQAIDPNLLSQRWIHSREEDTATEMVYRPAGFPLPPSRGPVGSSNSIRMEHSSALGSVATDISNVQPGSWQIETPNRIRYVSKWTGRSQQ